MTRSNLGKRENAGGSFETPPSSSSISEDIYRSMAVPPPTERRQPTTISPKEAPPLSPIFSSAIGTTKFAPTRTFPPSPTPVWRSNIYATGANTSTIFIAPPPPENQPQSTPPPWRATPYINGADTPLLPGQRNAHPPGDTRPTPAPPPGETRPPTTFPPAEPRAPLTGDIKAPPPSDPNKNGDTPKLIWQPPGRSSQSAIGQNATGDRATGDDTIRAAQAEKRTRQVLSPQYGSDTSWESTFAWVAAGGTGGFLGSHVLPRIGTYASTKVMSAASSGGMLEAIAQRYPQHFDPARPLTPLVGKDWHRGALGSVVQGVGFAGVNLVLDHYIDKTLFGNDHKQGLGLSNSIIVPMTFALGKSTGTKIGASLIAGTCGLLLDKALGNSGNREMSQFLAPTSFEALSMSAAWMLPAKTPQTQALTLLSTWTFNRMTQMDTKWSLGTAAVAGTVAALRVGGDWKTKVAVLAADAVLWGASRVLHPDSTDWNEVRDEAKTLIKDDGKERSASSMTEAIDKYRELGAKKELVIRSDFEEFFIHKTGVPADALQRQRKGAILAAAFGEQRLSMGTLIPRTETPEYLEVQKGLDFGGEGLLALQIARVSVDEAKRQTQASLGKEIDGKKVTESERSDLDKVGMRIDKSMNEIYGKHDMEGAVEQLQNLARRNPVGTFELMRHLADNITNDTTGDKKFVAKLYRDFAALSLALAKNKSDSDAAAVDQAMMGTVEGRSTPTRTGKPRGFDGAWQAINLAAQNDPENADLKQLTDLAQAIRPPRENTVKR